MSAERFKASLAFVLKWEGSQFTNDPDDHGGATRFGVIQREYNAFRQARGEPVRSVQHITMDEVQEIYRREYWEKVQGDSMPVPLDMVMFDTGVLMGVTRAIQFLQRSLNIRASGNIGTETRGALAATADAQRLAEKFMDVREAFLRGIVQKDPTQRKFLNGWLNRLNDLRRTIARFGPMNASIEEQPEEALVPEEDSVMGRAIIDLPEDFTDADEGVEEAPRKLSFLEKMGPAAFVEAVSSLNEISEGQLYVIETRASERDRLTVIAGASGSDRFEIPLAAIESITPLSLDAGNSANILAAIIFRPEFQALSASINRFNTGSRTDPFADEYSLEQSGITRFGTVGPSLAISNQTGVDNDPGNPASADETALNIRLARTITNYGGVEPGTSEPPVTTSLETLEETFGPEITRAEAQTLPLDISLAQTFLNSCMNPSTRVRYGLGAKVPFHGAIPGRQFTRVDCSGFVREAIWRASSPHFAFPDGSVQQRDWIRAHNFKPSTPDEAQLRDGAIRIAFLRPQDSPSHIGHVALVHNAQTLESHGGVGPDSRPWNKTGWQARAFVYLLTPPRG